MMDFTQVGSEYTGQMRLPSPGSPEPAEREGEFFAFPLAPAQERMWIADRKEPGNPAYNGSFRWNIEGALNPRLLERAFNEIVRRHEVLRATFAESESGPIQIISPSLQVRIDVQDLRSVPMDRREAELDRLSAEEATRRFDLEKGPLIRVGLVRMEDSRHVLALTIHHIISDGWSIGLIMEELQKIYGAFADGRETPLPDLRIQYTDWVVWERERAGNEESAKQLAYWENKLAGYQRLDVPTDFPRPSQPTTNSAIISSLLPRDLTDALKEFSNQQGGTFFTTTLAACMALLTRHTGKNDIALGSPLAGRNRTDIEDLIGLFINHVVFRADASGDPPFPEFAARVRDTVWEAFASQDIPFETVLKALRPADPYGDPFYAINFICQREYARASTFVFEFAGLRMSTMPSKSQGALYDLNFFIVEREAGWRLSVEYNTDLYLEATAQQMLSHFRELLEAIVENPNRRLSEFPLSGEAVVPGSAATAGKPAASTMTGSNNEVKQNALDTGETYAMPASSIQARFWLLSKLAPDNAAFHMPACVRLSGPLSEDNLEKSFQSLLDRHEILRTTFDEIDGQLAQVIAPAAKASLSVANIENLQEADRESRIGDLIREEAGDPFDLVRGPLFRAKLFRIRPDDHILVVTLHHIIADGWSQNVFQRELWSAYQALSDGKNISPPRLAIQYGDFAAWQKEWLASEQAREHLDFWTKQLPETLPIVDFPTDRPPNNRLPSRGAIETLLLPEDLTASLKHLAQSENVTMFMLTLACFGALLFRYAGQEDMLIGSPVANRSPETEPLIGPFARPIALRLDLAGDPTFRELLQRVRDVTFDALGHTDLPFEVLLDKVKARSVHGRNPLFQFYFFYQAAFLQPHQAGNVTVTPMPTFSVGTPFEMQIGIIERQEGVRAQLEYNPDLFDAETIQDVLRYYETVLRVFAANPEEHVQQLDSPVRRLSASLAQADATPVHEYVAPRNAIELKLVQIWQEVLDRPHIGIRDNFFELGGQSLLAARLMADLEKQFHVRIDLSSLITAPTIEDLARKVKAEDEGKASYIVPLRASGANLPLFCIHCGTGHVLRYRDMTAIIGNDQPVYGLRSPDLDGAQKSVTVEDLAAKYISDIRGVQPHGPYRLCGLSFGGLVAYELAAKLAAQGEDVSVLALFDTGNPAYYRNLSFSKFVLFQSTYLIDRFKKYGRNLFRGDVKKIGADVGIFFGRRGAKLAWKIVRRAAQMMDRPVPAAIRDNAIMFTTIGQAYTPKPYPGKIQLFRAEGRTPEYGDDLALGWDGIANGGVEIHHVPGEHTTLLEKPHVYSVVEQLKRCMSETPVPAPTQKH
ncbi:MAG: condensation domain-containing protein [Candidatus Acidiferrales bacterium]